MTMRDHQIEPAIASRRAARGNQVLDTGERLPTRSRVSEQTLSPGNPARAEADWPPAVIAGAYRTGVLAVRSLRRRGVRTFCVDSIPENPGFRSVYGRARLCPDPDIDPDGWTRFMIDLARTIGTRAVLIPSSDRFVSAIARNVAVLSEHYILSPGAGLQGLLADKHTQYELAARHGMPMPRTQFATCREDVVRFAEDAVFPCLLKPTHFREWLRCSPDHPLFAKKIAIAGSAAELLDLYAQAAPINPRVILQEIIEGPDSAKRVYLSCYDANGRRIANALFRELRCNPLGFGPATITEPIEDPEVDEVCDGFLRRIGYVGLCEIEIKQDSRDGRFKLIEANPRLSGSGDAAPYAGVDLCWVHYLDAIGQSVSPVTPDTRDFRHMVVRDDAIAVVAYRRAGLISWKDILRSYRPPLAFYDLDARDWRYSAETLYVATRSLLGGLSQALFQKR
jgi:predicted ATP-grasp superfamily ATP-dependent carboligase